MLARRPLTKDDLIKLAKKMGFILSQVDAVECLLTSQGGTSNYANFSFDYLVDWMVINIPRMRAW